MLRILPPTGTGTNASYTPPTGTGTNAYTPPTGTGTNASYTPPYGYRHKCFVYSSNLLRYPFFHIASTLYMNQSMMTSPCEIILKNIFYVHVYKRNRNAIIYIYIIYRNMKTISKILNIRKKFLTEHY